MILNRRFLVITVIDFSAVFLLLRRFFRFYFRFILSSFELF
jgi:hypothetical protein